MIDGVYSPFNSYSLCNFNDSVREEDLINESLQQLWFGKEASVKQLERIIKNWIISKKTMLNEKEIAFQRLADFVQIFFAFLQQNFTGPFVDIEPCREMLERLNLANDYEPFERLKRSGEEINPNVKNGELLVIAYEIIEVLREAHTESEVLTWWHMRLICTHQHIIDDLADELYNHFLGLSSFLIKNDDSFFDKELHALLYLEVANGYLQFHRSNLAGDMLDKLCDKLQIELKVEGLLGLRTKFQQKPLPQLCLKIIKKSDEDITLPSASATNGNTNLPKLLLLEDDTRLERIRFIEPQDNEVMTLPSILQALVLAKVRQLKRSQPKDRLADEELEPYIQTLLYQTNGPLQVRQSALLLNCIQESGMRRTVERSWKQCEVCVKLLDNTERYTQRERLSYGFVGFLQPKWHVQMQLCELMRSLGMTKTALDIYLQIQAWEQVIDCYTSLELRHKAAEIIRQQLEKKPTALLYCLLGDAEDAPKYYQEAWTFSKEKSSKAQAYWGNYHFRRHEYKDAIEHFKLSLDINMLQEKILLRYGYCAIQLEHWETAVHAYISYTHLEPNGFESWNNLAKALIKLGDKQRAYKVLGESLKCNYTNWKVWENFMLVSVDTGHYEDAIRAYNRLNEIKDRFLDLEVLTLIIHGVVKAVEESKEQSQLLLKRAVTLMGQQCIKHGNDHLIWLLSSLVSPTPLKKAEKLVKAYRAFTSKDVNWFTKPEEAVKALKICNDMCEYSLAAIDLHAADETNMLINSQLSSSRLAAQSCISALKRATNVEVTKEQEEQLNQLNDLVPKITETLHARMTTT